MAKGNLFLGFGRKKLGDLVFYRANGAQITRARNRAPKNPRSVAQAKQRMAFAQATSAAAGLKFIINHSFEGLNTENENVQHFVAINSKLLRAEIEAQLDGTGAFHGNAQIMGAKGMQGADYIISKGSVYLPAFSSSSDYKGGVSYPIVTSLEDAAATITTQEEYEAALAAIGCAPGDQLSLIGIFELPTTIASYDTEYNYLNKCFASRVTFKQTIPDGFSGKLIVDTAFNESLIEESYGAEIAVGTGQVSDVDSFIMEFQEDADVPAAATMQSIGIVRSRRNLNGKYEYSPCQLIWVGEGNDVASVLPSYMNVQNQGAGSDYFLDQAEVSPNS